MNFHRLLRELPTKEQQLSTQNDYDDKWPCANTSIDEPAYKKEHVRSIRAWATCFYVYYN